MGAKTIEVGPDYVFRVPTDVHRNVSWQRFTGRKRSPVPEPWRNAHDPDLVHADTIVEMTGDRWTNPESGGIGDLTVLRGFYGVGSQQFMRYVLPTLDYVIRIGHFVFTNVWSAYADGLRYQEAVRATHCRNLKQYRTHVSGSSKI